MKDSIESMMTLSAGELVPIICEVLEQDGQFTLQVTGSSMIPTLRDGREMVRLVSPSVRTVREGEIVFFQRDSGEYILHRIYKELPDGSLKINGDAQNWCETIEKRQVIAVVSQIYRKERWISCDSIIYRLYVSLWRMTRPLRPWIFRVRSWMLTS